MKYFESNQKISTLCWLLAHSEFASSLIQSFLTWLIQTIHNQTLYSSIIIFINILCTFNHRKKDWIILISHSAMLYFCLLSLVAISFSQFLHLLLMDLTTSGSDTHEPVISMLNNCIFSTSHNIFIPVFVNPSPSCYLIATNSSRNIEKIFSHCSIRTEKVDVDYVIIMHPTIIVPWLYHNISNCSIAAHT